LMANQNFIVLFRCFNLMVAKVYSAARLPLHEFKKSSDKIKDIPFSSQGLTYGLLAEYAFLTGMFNEARVWTIKFEQFLFTEIAGKKTIILPRR